MMRVNRARFVEMARLGMQSGGGTLAERYVVVERGNLELAFLGDDGQMIAITFDGVVLSTVPVMFVVTDDGDPDGVDIVILSTIDPEDFTSEPIDHHREQ